MQALEIVGELLGRVDAAGGIDAREQGRDAGRLQRAHVRFRYAADEDDRIHHALHADSGRGRTQSL